MRRCIVQLGLGLFIACALMMVPSKTVSAQVPPAQPECAAPCFFDQTSGDLFCPCDSLNNAVVPEPMTLALLGGGLLGAAALKKRKK